MRCQAVFFDIDGTLVDSNGLHVAAWVEAFAEHGHEVAPEAVAAQIGMGADNLVPALIPGADPRTAKKLGDRHGAIFKDRYLDQVRAFPQARALIEEVHRSGRKVVLASSASQAELDHYVKLLDLKGLVDADTTIDDVPHSKPAPDIFIAALGKVAPIEAGAVVVVGDTPYDMDPARYCGMVPVAVRSGGFADQGLREAGAAAVYDDVAALLAEFGESLLAG